jgi:hypothetical protein
MNFEYRFSEDKYFLSFWDMPESGIIEPYGNVFLMFCETVRPFS